METDEKQAREKIDEITEGGQLHEKALLWLRISRFVDEKQAQKDLEKAIKTAHEIPSSQNKQKAEVLKKIAVAKVKRQ